MIFYDFNEWMQAVLDHPKEHGFDDAINSGAGDSDKVWWSGNDLHITSHMHRELAKDMVKSLEKLGWSD